MNENKNQKRYLSIGYLVSFKLGNPNSGEGGGNVIPLKKVRKRDGKLYPYISGQAFRWYLKYTMNSLDPENFKLTKVDEKGDVEIGNENNVYDVIKKHSDLDVFGFMKTIKKQKTLRRWSPVKVSPLISQYEWDSFYDLLTRRKEDAKGGDYVKQEGVEDPIMDGSMVVSVDEISAEVNESNLNIKKNEESKEIRKNRVKLLLKALMYLSGGAKASRMMIDLSPKLVIAVKQKGTTPILYDFLEVDKERSKDGKIHLNEEKLKYSLNTRYRELVEKVYIFYDKHNVDTDLNSDINNKNNKENDKEIQIFHTSDPKKFVEEIIEDLFPKE